MKQVDTVPFTMADIENLEEQLRLAMLAGDVDVMSELLDDDLVLVDHQGRRLGKAQDLEAHSSGLLKLDRVDFL